MVCLEGFHIQQGFITGNQAVCFGGPDRSKDRKIIGIRTCVG